MAITMQDGLGLAVDSSLIRNWGRASYAIDLMTDAGAAIERNQVIDLPSTVDPTLIEDADVETDPQAYSPTSEYLRVNRHPGHFIRIGAADGVQRLGGTWAEQVAIRAVSSLKTRMDEQFAHEDLIEGPLAANASSPAAEHKNLEGDALTRADIESAIAEMVARDGVEVADLLWLINPFAMGAVRASSTFVEQTRNPADGGALGIGLVGMLSGIPAAVTASVPHDNGAAAAASLNPGAYARVPTSTVSSSGTVTCTFAASPAHGFVVGQRVRLLAADAAFNGVGTVSAVTATTVVFDVSGSGTATSTLPGVLVANSSMAILVAVNRCFVAQQVIPSVRVVPLPNSSASSLQVTSLWGARCVANSAVAVHSLPYDVADAA